MVVGEAWAAPRACEWRARCVDGSATGKSLRLEASVAMYFSLPPLFCLVFHRCVRCRCFVQGGVRLYALAVHFRLRLGKHRSRDVRPCCPPSLFCFVLPRVRAHVSGVREVVGVSHWPSSSPLSVWSLPPPSHHRFCPPRTFLRISSLVCSSCLIWCRCVRAFAFSDDYVFFLCFACA